MKKGEENMDRSIKTTLLNMCMIYDETNNKVLVLDKVKKENDDWYGYTFPGGHVENGESLIDSTIREVKEETGLDVFNLIPCGVIDWDNADEPERWLVFLYKTKAYNGELIGETKEGKVFWMDKESFLDSKLAPNMKTYMELFSKDDVNEAYATWNKGGISEFKLL